MNQFLIKKQISQFIYNYSDRRLRQETLDYYKNELPRRHEIVCISARIGEELIGLTGCALDENKNVLHSYTVVHPDYRGKQVGFALLQAKLILFKHRRLKFISTVADDNVASRRNMEKNGLKIVREIPGERTRYNRKTDKEEKQAYKILVFEDV